MPGEPGYLILSTGDVLEGEWLSKIAESEGEIIFNTTMTGLQDVITDPSYAGQIITFTYPFIGNDSWNEKDFESSTPFMSGLIVKNEPYMDTLASLKQLLDKYNIPALYDIDTRKLTTIIRNNGKVFGQFSREKHHSPMMKITNPDIVKDVSTSKIKHFPPTNIFSERKRIVLIDFGYKRSIVRSLNALGCHVFIVPFNSSFAQISSLYPDGVLLSNGPGNPADLSSLTTIIRKVANQYPTLGIGLGHQLLAMAYGATTSPLPIGHRGSNHPVKEMKTGKVYITTQNHGYAVDEKSIDLSNWIITYRNVNDQSVEGFVHRNKPIMAVQFHPDSDLSSNDSCSIFKDFYRFITNGVKQHA